MRRSPTRRSRSSCATAAPASTAMPCRPIVAGSLESIEGRLERAGGRATIVSSPGGGTEVELHLLRGAS